MDKTYRPAEVEKRHYEAWERSGAFASDLSRAGARDSNRIPFTIVIPPPNVTGSLHMGHALNNTLQDVLIRYRRLRGRDTLWQPGMDHAGIATQMVVERELAREGKTRHDLGRDGLIERIWQWKAQSGGAIAGQLRRLGASCDWSRERFTMDEGLSLAVRHVFVTLYKEGLIYRDKRLVNWDPKLLTAISDLEVEQREEPNGKLWHFRYPIEGEDGAAITVATTRPETMLGDTAVAVHPEDDRYRTLVGRYAVLPLVGRRIPIVADDYSDPEKGSGAVKITPAHDFNDFEVARRHDLPMVDIFDETARLNDGVPEPYRGLDRFEARKRIVADMDRLGLLEKVEDNPMAVPYGDRSGVVIEPRLTDQWYVDAVRLAGPAIEAVERGATRFVPRRWENTFFHWMRNIQPWCISRQIWWGHRVPAWYAPDGRIFVEMTEEETQKAAEAHYGHAVELTQDSDVLDTWFSSALWPFSTLGWPERTPALERYYPTDVLVTGFDIIFFWVARMMMMGLHFLGEVPFRTVYIHGLVLDEKGEKMSKTRGNVVDPLEQIDAYGADVLRFSLVSDAAQGRDVRWSGDRVSGARYFVTKLWNAARYVRLSGCVPVPAFDPSACRLTVNRWIIGELAGARREIDLAFEDYRFSDAASAAYRFTWDTFCDWYLEFTKPILGGGDAAVAEETRAVASWVLDQLLHLLHPFVPFVTEELWEQLAPEDRKRATALISSSWPAIGAELESAEAKAEMDWVIGLVSEIRSIRSTYNVEPSKEIAIGFADAGEDTRRRISEHETLITPLARLKDIEPDVSDQAPGGTVQFVHGEATVRVYLADAIRIEEEITRLEKAVAHQDREIAVVRKKLANESFVSKAPVEVVEEQRRRLAEHEQTRIKVVQALERLSSGA